MDEKIKMLCGKTHGIYCANKIYDCIYSHYDCSDSKYFKIYYNNNDYEYADENKDYCNLKYFYQLDNGKITISKIKQNTILNYIIKIINSILKTKIKNKSKIINVSYNLDVMIKKRITSINIYNQLIKPIELIQKSELYEMYQDKIHYIFSKIEKLNELEEYVDVEDRMSKYAFLIENIYKVISKCEKQGKKNADNQIKEKIKNYLDKEDELLDGWNNFLKEMEEMEN